MVHFRAVFVSSLLLAPLAAQTVWNVPAPNGMQATINAASPGDILVLTNPPGSFGRDYEPFTLNKGLTIRGNGALIGTAMFSTVYQITIDVPPLTLRDCGVRGAIASQWPTPARAGLLLTASLLHAERVLVSGGGNLQLALVSQGAPGIDAVGSTMFLSDSTLRGGTSLTGAPGTALVNANGPTASLCQTALVPGTGGQPSVGPIDPNALLLRLGRPTPWQRGATSTLQLTGQPNSLFALWLAPDTTSTLLAPVVEPLVVLTGAPILVGLLDTAGAANYSVAVPQTASLEHATVWCQAHGGLQLPLHASTIAGGVIH